MRGACPVHVSSEMHVSCACVQSGTPLAYHSSGGDSSSPRQLGGARVSGSEVAGSMLGASPLRGAARR